MGTGTGRDRRIDPRLEGHFPVDVLNMGDDPTIAVFEDMVRAEALDVSRHGMQIRAPYHVSVGSLLSVLLYYKGHESICLTEVVWNRDNNGEMVYGLHFKEWSTLDPSLAEALEKMEVAEKAA